MLKRGPLYILPLLLYLVIVVSSSTIEYDGLLNIKLQHDLSPNQNSIFADRGNITIQSLRLGQSTINQVPLSAIDRSTIEDLAANNKYYTMKATVIANDGSETSFISTIKACMLAEAELNDIISIYLDYSGRVITVTNVIASTSTCEGAVVSLGNAQFSTSVFVRHTSTGPVPDTASYIQQLEREREARERGELKDNRSFLAKYWMYIIPLVLIMVLSSAANPDGGAGASR